MRVLLPIALLVAATASAQEVQQTPENAQRFLSLAAESFPMEVEEPHQGQGFIHYDLVSITQGGDVCTSLVEATPTWFTGSGKTVSQGDLNRLPDIRRKYGFSAPPFTIDWSVTRISETADLRTGQPYLVLASPDLTLHLLPQRPDPAFQKRLVYAMEFLKATCDKTAETGF